MCWAADQMRSKGEEGSLVTLICDSGERYLETYHSAEWRRCKGIDIEPHVQMLEGFIAGGPFIFRNCPSHSSHCGRAV